MSDDVWGDVPDVSTFAILSLSTLTHAQCHYLWALNQEIELVD